MNKLLLKRKSKSHKGTYGRVGVIGGSTGMTGSIYLTSQASLRTGSGLVYTIIPKSLETIMSIKLTECIIKPIADRGNGHFIYESIVEIGEIINDMDVIALGPGLGVDKSRIGLIKKIIENSNIPMIIDADGLNCLAEDMKVLKNNEQDIIITPHFGEASRLLDVDIRDIEKDPEYYANLLSRNYNVITVLKSEATVVTSPKGEIYNNEIGNAGIATAGSGDVLTGIISSLKGQGLGSFDASRLGVYLHSLAGDMAAEDKGEYGMIAGDILEKLPYAIKNHIEKNS